MALFAVTALSRRHIYYGWAIVGVAFVVGMAEVMLYNPVLSVFINPMERELGWSRATFSGAVSVGVLLGGVASLVIGPVLDRRGPRLIVVVAGAVISLALMALASVQEVWHFYLFYGMGRVANTAGISLSLTVAISNWFILFRGRVTGLSLLGNRVGGVVLPLFLQSLIGLWGWRVGWVALGLLVPLLALLPSALFLGRRPEDYGLQPDGAPDQGGGRREPGRRVRASVSSGEISWSLAEAVRTKALWLLTLGIALAFLVAGALNLHEVPYFIDRGIAPADAVLALAIASGGSAVGGVLWGYLMERYPVRWLMAFVLLVASGAVFYLLSVDTAAMAFLFAAIHGVSFGGMLTLVLVVYAHYFGRESLGAIRGFVQPFQLVGNASGPLFAGWVRDVTGHYGLAFTVFGVLYLLAALSIVLAAPPRKLKPAVSSVS